MKIVIDNAIPYIRGAAELLGECVYLSGSEISASDVKDADALIIRTRTKCNQALLDGSAVKFIATATIGYDHLDTAYLDEVGIGWTNCPGCNAASVAQYVESAMLQLSTEGIISLADCTVGVVGVGHVGSLVAARLSALGCSVLKNDPPRQEREGGYFVSLADIQQAADVITFHTPLTTTGPHPTHHLASNAFMRGLKKRPLIINTSRGEVVDTTALKTAINEGLIRQAVIDTWENEPHIDRELLATVCIGTPHIAGYSADGKANGTRMALQAVAKFFGIEKEFDIQPPELPEGTITASDPVERKLQFYNPLRDSEALKKKPTLFEQLRSNYPLRREYIPMINQ